MESPDSQGPGHRGPALYNSVIVRTFVQFIQFKYLHVNIGEVLDHAGMLSHQVEDESHWFTQDQVDRFHDWLVRATGNRNLARDAGRFTSSREGMGALTRYGLGFAGPARVFELIGEVTKRYTRSSRYESSRRGQTTYELRVTPHSGVREKEYQCQNRIGYFEAVVQVFNSRLPKIEHPECVFRGDKSCVYRVTWRESRAQAWKTSRNLLAAALVVGLPVLGFLTPLTIFFPAAVTGLVVFLGASLGASALANRELNQAIEHLRTTTDELYDSSSRHYEHALMVNEVGRIIGRYHRIETLLPQVIEVLRQRLDYDRGMILLTSEDGRSLEYRTGFGYSPEQVEELTRESLHLDRPRSRGVFVLCHREQRPFLINDVDTIQGTLSERSRRFLHRVGSKSFLCCPILLDGKCFGVLAVDNMKTKRPLLESDLNLLMGIAPEIGLSLSNALLTDQREQQFQSMVRTLAASIDARDSLTSGHSQRVTDFAVALCRELHLDSEFTEVVRVAAQLHDYGKIAIKDSILKKEGPLTLEERLEIETHAARSEELLSQVQFLGAYQQVPRIAGAHHERLDGKGYPQGLRGDQIPWGARIIAVADFFEAITAKRHYREPMSFEQAVALLRRESGDHLEPAIVDAMLRVLGVLEPAPSGPFFCPSRR